MHGILGDPGRSEIAPMRESRPGRPVDEAVSGPPTPSPQVPDELAGLSAETILEAIAEPCCILEIDGYQGRVVWISAAQIGRASCRARVRVSVGRGTE